LPGRVVAAEDRVTALEQRVLTKIEEMRAELAEIRTLLAAQLQADADTTELVGKLLQDTRTRLSAIEEIVATTPPSGPET
jgi:hypothetical protein